MRLSSDKEPEVLSQIIERRRLWQHQAHETVAFLKDEFSVLKALHLFIDIEASRSIQLRNNVGNSSAASRNDVQHALSVFTDIVLFNFARTRVIDEIRPAVFHKVEL